ncbi:hypothetical protein RhiJN_24675 [Ceratobasidium sp. AG-Ba]|nr:hypothetical protein RhiJN_24675 [Ceratobasidium sp. AG-Ba]
MVRGGTMYARAACRAVMRAPMLSQANGTYPSEVSRLTCPYCGKEFHTTVGRDLHVSFQLLCRALHQARVSGKAGQKRRREYKEDSLTTESTEAQLAPKWVRFETAEAMAGPSRHPNALDTIHIPVPVPNPTLDSASSAIQKGARGYTRNGVYVEPYPISTAGAPLGRDRKDEQDLRDYLKAYNDDNRPQQAREDLTPECASVQILEKGEAEGGVAE